MPKTYRMQWKQSLHPVPENIRRDMIRDACEKPEYRAYVWDSVDRAHTPVRLTRIDTASKGVALELLITYGIERKG